MSAENDMNPFPYGYPDNFPMLTPIETVLISPAYPFMTFRNKIIMNLSNKEKENGLTYTGFSRATKLSNIGIIGGLSLERFTVKIRNHRKMKPRRKEEERQISLSNQTVKEIIELREKGVITVRYTDYN
jgi:hypothetical protein